VKQRRELVTQVAGHLHADQRVEAARLIAAFSGHEGAIEADDALEWCNSLFYWCLNNDHYEWAAEILLPKNLFHPDPHFVKLIWANLRSHSTLLLSGAASTSKTYSTGVWMFLDWIRDPEFTNVNVVGPSENHLKDNLFSHLVNMHEQASLPIPGIIGDLFIGLNPKQRKSAIRGVVLPIGKKGARLQGTKRVPRPKPHPVFGPLSRLRFLIDEAEECPPGLWKDINNVYSGLSKDDPDSFKLVLAFNPSNPHGPVAERAAPSAGLHSIDLDYDEEWDSKKDWRVVRLDGKKCENVIEGREVYPGLLTREAYERIEKDSGGPESPGAMTMDRGWFPTETAFFSLISSTIYAKLRGEFIFAETPVPFGSVDLALEGKDLAEFCSGKFGRAIGYRTLPDLENPTGTEVFFKDPHGNKVLRYAIQVEQLFTLVRGDTVVMAKQVKTTAIKLGIAPGHLMLDRTGNGAGVHDYLLNDWNPEVMGVNYQNSATDRKILEEDTKKAKDEYDRAHSELWFALKKFAEFDVVKASAVALTPELESQITGRRYAPGKVNRVEKKKDYINRGNHSPNKADALTLLVHGVRLAEKFVPSAVSPNSGNVVGGSSDRDAVPHTVDSTNKFDDLE